MISTITSPAPAEPAISTARPRCYGAHRRCCGRPSLPMTNHTVGAPSFAAFCEGWVADWSHNGLRLSRRVCLKRNLLPTLVHPLWSGLVEKIEAVTAPAPILRCRRQTSLHRIVVHIAQFLHPLLLCPNIEIMKTNLPERRARRNLAKQLDLARIARFRFRQQGASRALLQYLHHRGRGPDLWLAQ